MNLHTICSTCLHNEANVCTKPANRYHNAPLKSWNTCSSHTAPLPTPAELCGRLATCAAALDHLAAKAAGEYRDYWADRARQCRSWLADLQEGHRVGDEDIVGGAQRL